MVTQLDELVSRIVDDAPVMPGCISGAVYKIPMPNCDLWLVTHSPDAANKKVMLLPLSPLTRLIPIQKLPDRLSKDERMEIDYIIRLSRGIKVPKDKLDDEDKVWQIDEATMESIRQAVKRFLKTL